MLKLSYVIELMGSFLEDDLVNRLWPYRKFLIILKVEI